MNFEVINWEKISVLCLKLALTIKSSGFQPDIIIGISKGGVVPARILADMLGVTTLLFIRCKHYTSPMEKVETKLVGDLPTPVEGNVLIVDDIFDTGESLQVVENYVQAHFPGYVRTATLQSKQRIQVTEEPTLPDFVAENISLGTWIVYPWDYFETIRGNKK